jgi:hypothetical protein
MAMVDEKKQVIVAAEAHGLGQEHGLLVPLVGQTEKNPKEAGKRKTMEGATLVADANYYSESNCRYCDEKKIDASLSRIIISGTVTRGSERIIRDGRRCARFSSLRKISSSMNKTMSTRALPGSSFCLSEQKQFGDISAVTRWLPRRSAPLVSCSIDV